MGAGGYDPVTALLRYFADHAPQPGNLPAHFLDVLADLGTHLHLRLEEFRLDLVAKYPLALIENLGDVGSQFPGFGVDDLVFLFDAEGHVFEVHGVSGSKYPGPVDRPRLSCQKPIPDNRA